MTSIVSPPTSTFVCGCARRLWYQSGLVGAATIDVTASEAVGAERDRLFDAQTAAMPQFAAYAQRTERTIPVIVLTPR